MLRTSALKVCCCNLCCFYYLENSSTYAEPIYNITHCQDSILIFLTFFKEPPKEYNVRKFSIQL
uniref:MIP32812p1 n=1 Tax=Drosophila melanogaster TaxID=7227 RepID=H0RN64_DROME|nr:MIP32812p1 [Drosophila melanogaster]